MDFCPRTCSTEDSCLCTYRTDQLGLQDAMLAHCWTCLFFRDACSTCCASGLFRVDDVLIQAAGRHLMVTTKPQWLCGPRLYRLCTYQWCQQGAFRDEKQTVSVHSNTVFECPALYNLQDRYEILCQAPQEDAMILFMWQNDFVGVAPFLDACLSRMYTTAGLPLGDHASNQPLVGCKGCYASSSSSIFHSPELKQYERAFVLQRIPGRHLQIP